MREFEVPTEEAMRALGASLVASWSAGDLVLLQGELGAGKTTLVRGVLWALGWTEPVRSPTFNLLQVYPTEPPVLHADLYRLKGGGLTGLGLEDYLDSHLCLVEWPERAEWPAQAWLIQIERKGDARLVRVSPPA